MAFLKRPSVNRQRAKIKRFKFQVEQMDDDMIYEVPLEGSKAKMKGSGKMWKEHVRHMEARKNG